MTLGAQFCCQVVAMSPDTSPMRGSSIHFQISAGIVNSAPQSRLSPFIFDWLISAVGTARSCAFFLTYGHF